jgi:hypothetical protein
MDTLFTTILDLLNGLMPSALLTTFEGLNEILAYVITISLIWGVLLRPVLKAFKVVK